MIAFPRELSCWEAHGEHIQWEPVLGSQLESLAQGSPPGDQHPQLSPEGLGMRQKLREPSFFSLGGEKT